jgi:threonine dehydratase
MRLLLLRLKLLVEPTGAVPAALLLSGRWREADDTTSRPRIGVILSGGNVDPVLLCDVLSEARAGG